MVTGLVTVNGNKTVVEIDIESLGPNGQSNHCSRCPEAWSRLSGKEIESGWAEFRKETSSNLNLPYGRMNLNMGNYSEFLTGLAEPLFKDGFSVSRDIVSKPEYKADPQYNLEVVPGVCW